MSLPTQADSEDHVNQFREFLSSYNKLADICFGDCVHDFTKRTLTNSEESCAMTCLEKYLKATQRVSMRFQEHQLALSEGAAVK